MAKKGKPSGVRLRRGEIIGGIIYLPFYVLLTALSILWISKTLDVNLSAYQLNVVVFVVDFIAIVAIFHRFLFDSLRQIGHAFWQFIQAVILAVVFYFAMNYAVSLIYTIAGVTLQNSNNDDIMTMVGNHFVPMLICTCALVPVVEECLCRGLLFGTLREKNRILAYAVSMLAFALLHVWQYFGQYSFWNALLVTVSYLPAGLALAWAYEKGGTIWASILTHAIVNFVACTVQYL